MAAIVSPALGRDLPAAGTNPRLFWTQGHKQCGQPTICIPEPYLCQARGRCSWGAARQSKQTEHCARGRADKHISLRCYSPCWVHKLKSNGSSWFKVSPTFICGIPQQMSWFWFSRDHSLILSHMTKRTWNNWSLMWAMLYDTTVSHWSSLNKWMCDLNWYHHFCKACYE